MVSIFATKFDQEFHTKFANNVSLHMRFPYRKCVEKFHMKFHLLIPFIERFIRHFIWNILWNITWIWIYRKVHWKWLRNTIWLSSQLRRTLQFMSHLCHMNVTPSQVPASQIHLRDVQWLVVVTTNIWSILRRENRASNAEIVSISRHCLALSSVRALSSDIIEVYNSFINGRQPGAVSI